MSDSVDRRLLDSFVLNDVSLSSSALPRANAEVGDGVDDVDVDDVGLLFMFGSFLEFSTSFASSSESFSTEAFSFVNVGDLRKLNADEVVWEEEEEEENDEDGVDFDRVVGIVKGAGVKWWNLIKAYMLFQGPLGISLLNSFKKPKFRLTFGWSFVTVDRMLLPYCRVSMQREKPFVVVLLFYFISFASL